MKGRDFYEVNDPAAIPHLKQAALGGVGEAAWCLGMAHMTGKCGLGRNGNEAVNWWLVGWEARYAPCAGSIGYAYAKGHTSEGRSIEKARTWLKIAVDNGVGPAAAHLAELHNDAATYKPAQ